MTDIKKEHPYAHVLRAIADGEKIQWKNSKNEWVDENAINGLLHDIAASEGDTVDRYRIKPKTININGHEVPEPLRAAPKYNTTYYITSVHNKEPYRAYIWHDDDIDTILLKRGICHLNKEAAIAHAKALLSFTETVSWTIKSCELP